jgi:hypothetical protein
MASSPTSSIMFLIRTDRSATSFSVRQVSGGQATDEKCGGTTGQWARTDRDVDLIGATKSNGRHCGDVEGTAVEERKGDEQEEMDEVS